jgi:hypothetical protein
MKLIWTCVFGLTVVLLGTPATKAAPVPAKPSTTALEDYIKAVGLSHTFEYWVPIVPNIPCSYTIVMIMERQKARDQAPGQPLTRVEPQQMEMDHRTPVTWIASLGSVVNVKENLTDSFRLLRVPCNVTGKSPLWPLLGMDCTYS